MNRIRLSALAVVCAATLVAATPAAHAQISLANPPPGANNWRCAPSAAHPDPVVLVHGLVATMSRNPAVSAPRRKEYHVCLLAAGLCRRFH